MRILMLAPQPFYQERGTVIALDLLLKALSHRGDSVDLVTMHLGESRAYPGLQIYRIRPWPRPTLMRPGFSLSKVWCDLFLFFETVKRLRRKRYDLIHAVEEGSFIALLLGKLFGVPYVYDMDSSMTTQILDRFKWASPFGGIMRRLELLPVKHATAVVPMCHSLANEIKQVCRGEVHVLKDVSLRLDSAQIREDLRENLGLSNEMLVMYIGNLEPYQGIDLLLDSFRIVHQRNAHIHLVIIGGCTPHIEHYKNRVTALNIDDRVHLLGPRPISAIGDFMKQADLLVSPRVQGTNTPMKIYSYLDSGRAVLATNLPTHTQVIDDTVAVLAPPRSEAFGEAMDAILHDTQRRKELVQQARNLIDREYSWEAFERQVNVIFDGLESRIGPLIQNN